MPHQEKYENTKQDDLAFVKEVAKYFKDFLETDFHKRKTPKRSIKFRNKDNLLTGLNLNKYPSFNNLIWKSINHVFDKNTINVIKKGIYKTNIPKDLLDLVKIQSDDISTKQINQILATIKEEIQMSVSLYKKDYDSAFNTSLEKASKIIKENLVSRFISNLKKPLENQGLVDENSVYIMEEELASVLVSTLENKISEIVKHLILEKKFDISKQLKIVFEIQDIKNSVLTFFESLKVGDLFTEVFEMERNRNILDKQEFYLYFCDITYNSVKYPIFYIPFAVEEQHNGLIVEFDYQVYINKKALEYITQEYNTEKGKRGSLKTISDRIIYLAQHREDFRSIISTILNEIVNFFELDPYIDIDNSKPQVSKSLLIRISNSCYLSLFDKSDEALVNDYEEILQILSSDNNELAEGFKNLIKDFIHKNPDPFNPEVENEWDNTETSDRLVYNTPIPLNSEQRQILLSLGKSGCKYVTVEGPPGTGKSHTITAISFESVLKNHSVLVLSDKKEALDVVENKITDAMNKVRHDKNFQNPILRLGKTGSTYSQILSTSSITNIKNNYRAVKKQKDTIKENIEKVSNSLKEDLVWEIITYNEVDIKEICEFFKLEIYYEKNGCIINIQEVSNQSESATELEEFRKIFKVLSNMIPHNQNRVNNNSLFTLLNISHNDFNGLSKFQEFLDFLTVLEDNIKKIKSDYGDKIFALKNFREFHDEDLDKLQKHLSGYENLKSRFLGYFLKGKQVEKLNNDFSKDFPRSKFVNPHKRLKDLRTTLDIFNYSLVLKKRFKYPIISKWNYINLVHQILIDDSIIDSIRELIALRENINYLCLRLSNYPKTLEKIKIDLSSLETFCHNELTEMSDDDFNMLIRYICLYQKINNDFKKIPEVNYSDLKENIEDLVTTQMTYLMDERLIDFYENNQADARVLRDIIKSKNRFPKDEFSKLKRAFPIILAGIRDYAEYIPLEPAIFDLVIIDEASQVSIAQAFPALLRAKKVLILGDKKQFSNVKSYQARTDTNKEYLNNLENFFRKNISEEDTKLVKLKKFNIKTSILEFFEFIRNYNTQLLKNYRGYKELISYSNKYFYQDNLQVMKIRGKPIDDVLKFSFVCHDNKLELIQNTNALEIDFIISELKKLKEDESDSSVGIITPHTNQQKLLSERINNLPDRDYFYNELQLKIMTFDTCQGEEKDIIFYSMVASEVSDKLWGIFISNLKSVDIEEEGKIKAQRLNVGFSRAKECMHFVLSEPIDKYAGSIGEALRHYYYVLEESKKERSPAETDQRSPMERKVLNWFYQTDFWKKNKDNIEFIPQFKIGEYLRQLDITYNHPRYEIDFLLVYKDETNKEYKIIIEYDGFKEHFEDIDEINELNYEEYYSEDDVYREKVLIDYGYKFLRINKFNIGDNPITTIDERINKLIKSKKKMNY